MGAIVLFHTGTPLPDHFYDCVRQIRKYSEISIYLISDYPDDPIKFGYDASKWPAINYIPSGSELFYDLATLYTKDYFNGFDLPAMWQGSCYRLFYIERLMKVLGLKDVLHFDNDVLLYDNPERIIDHCKKLYKDFTITAHSNDEVVFGMSYIPEYGCLSSLTAYIEDELSEGWAYLQQKYQGWPNEMRLLSQVTSSFLPILPIELTNNSQRYSAGYETFQAVFDPSSYGQFLGGTYGEQKPGWFGKHHTIGKAIADGSVQVAFENGGPVLHRFASKIKINNLHIHSKKTKDFV